VSIPFVICNTKLTLPRPRGARSGDAHRDVIIVIWQEYIEALIDGFDCNPLTKGYIVVLYVVG